jgi:hypothetical protein
MKSGRHLGHLRNCRLLKKGLLRGFANRETKGQEDGETRDRQVYSDGLRHRGTDGLVYGSAVKQKLHSV